MRLDVHLDDALYGCCGPELAVGRPVSWPLNFHGSRADDPQARAVQGRLLELGGWAENGEPGYVLELGSASLFASGELSGQPGDPALHGVIRYLDHGYVPDGWPATTGIVRQIRAGDGAGPTTWDRFDSQRMTTGSDTVVVIDVPDAAGVVH